MSFIINHGEKYQKHANRVSEYTKGKRGLGFLVEVAYATSRIAYAH
jgi:Zn/Cd-binding protein ZinT